MSKVSEKIDGTRKGHQIRFADAEWKRLEIAAEKIGLNVSEFVRSAALERAVKLEREKRV